MNSPYLRLTSRHVNQIRAFVDNWLDLRFANKPTDRAKAEWAIRGIYELLGLPPPEIQWFPNPLLAALAVVRRTLLHAKQQQVLLPEINPSAAELVLADGTTVAVAMKRTFRSQMIAISPAFRFVAPAKSGFLLVALDSIYRAIVASVYRDPGAFADLPVNSSLPYNGVFDHVQAALSSYGGGPWMVTAAGALDYLDRIFEIDLPGSRDVRELCTALGFFWMLKDVCLASDGPAQVSFDAKGRLHRETGPAVEYIDGWGLHFWHGHLVPGKGMIERDDPVSVGGPHAPSRVVTGALARHLLHSTHCSVRAGRFPTRSARAPTAARGGACAPRAEDMGPAWSLTIDAKSRLHHEADSAVKFLKA
jgi:hypothetical protein